MSQTLLTGASGLLSHQRKLDIVANNLANLNTTAYKSQRILFSDLLYTTIQPASSGTNADFGGTNPRQAGFGVSVAQTSRNHGQGVLSATGASFDFAIQDKAFLSSRTGRRATREQVRSRLIPMATSWTRLPGRLFNGSAPWEKGMMDFQRFRFPETTPSTYLWEQGSRAGSRLMQQ